MVTYMLVNRVAIAGSHGVWCADDRSDRTLALPDATRRFSLNARQHGKRILSLNTGVHVTL